MTSTVPDLPVPDEALTRLGEAVYRWEVSGQNEEAGREAVRAIAAPVVAAYLRRIASVMDGWDLECSGYARDRADELDAEETP